MEKVLSFNRYKENLAIYQDYDEDLFVKSYDTIVGQIDIRNKTLIEWGKWSNTTSRHINYVAQEMGLRVIPSKIKKEI